LKWQVARLWHISPRELSKCDLDDIEVMLLFENELNKFQDEELEKEKNKVNKKYGGGNKSKTRT
jgi:hypothetical protein